MLGGPAGLLLTGGKIFGPAFAAVAGGTGRLTLGTVIGLTSPDSDG
ncbi:hypothetical protein [Streptosporangium sandarakinum]